MTIDLFGSLAQAFSCSSTGLPSCSDKHQGDVAGWCEILKAAVEINAHRCAFKHGKSPLRAIIQRSLDEGRAQTAALKNVV
jgi:hypothetical protein